MEDEQERIPRAHLTLGTEFLLERQFGIIFEAKIGGGSSVGLAVSYKF